jgi:hypothetical protein
MACVAAHASSHPGSEASSEEESTHTPSSGNPAHESSHPGSESWAAVEPRWQVQGQGQDQALGALHLVFLLSNPVESAGLSNPAQDSDHYPN